MQKKMNKTAGLEVVGNATMFKKALLAVVVVTAGLQCAKAQSVQSPKGSEVFGSSTIVAPGKKVRIGWSFPVSLETPDLVFKVYSSTDLSVPIGSWGLKTNIPGSNRVTEVSAEFEKEFFVVTASNYLGESGFGTTQ